MPSSVSIQPCSAGKCLVAELDFEVGEVVLEETPLFEMPDDKVLSFCATSHYEAAWLYSQHCLSKDSFAALLSLGLSEGAASSGKVDEVNKALTKVAHAEYELALRFLIILMSNSFRFKGINGPTTALFEIMSRVNHSCNPNVRMIGDGRPAQLVAVRPIKKQEEVLLCYGGWETPFLRLPRIERRKRLLQHWGFHCECPRCEDDTSHTLKYCEDPKFTAAEDKHDNVQQPKAKT